MSTATVVIGEVISSQGEKVGYFRFVDGKAERFVYEREELAREGLGDPRVKHVVHEVFDDEDDDYGVGASCPLGRHPLDFIEFGDKGSFSTCSICTNTRVCDHSGLEDSGTLLCVNDVYWQACRCTVCGHLLIGLDPEHDDEHRYESDAEYRKHWPKAGHPLRAAERIDNLTIARVKTECPFCVQLVTDDHAGRCIPEMNNRLMIMQHGLQLAYAALKKSGIKREKCPELWSEMESAMSGMGAAPAAFFQGYFVLCESICKAVASGEDHAPLLEKWVTLQAKNKDGTLKEGKSVVNWKPGRQRQSREAIIAEALERPDVIEMLRKAGVKI